MQLFVDLDGVCADFDAHYLAIFGIRPDKLADNVDWAAVRAVPGFYENMPPMADLPVLWAAIEHFKPVILTGVPRSIVEAPANKIAWVRKHLGTVEVICCRSSDKCQYANPGDILIDDWEKYRHLWIAKGGRWITHRSAAETIERLKALLWGD